MGLSVSIIFLVTHICLVINLSPLWDGVIIENSTKQGNLKILTNWFFEAGLHTQPFYHQVISFLRDSLAVNPNLVAFLVLAGCTLLIFKILEISLLMTRDDAILVAVLFFSYPVFYVLTSEVMHWHLFSFLMFLSAWYLVFLGKGLVLGFILLMSSFFFSSLLVFHYFFVLMFACREMKFFSPTISMIIFFLKKNLVLMLLPVIFFLFKITYLKPYGIYEGYNKIEISSVSFEILLKSIQSVFTPIVPNRTWNIFILIPILLMLFFSSTIIKTNYNSPQKSMKLMFLSFVGLIMANLPYAAVNKLAIGESWAARFSLLAPLPAALTFFLISNWIGKLSGSQKLRKFFLGIVISCFIHVQTNFYRYSLVREVNDKSIKNSLQELDLPEKGSVILWKNDWVPVNDIVSYRNYELNYLVQEVVGDQVYYNEQFSLETINSIKFEVGQINNWKKIYLEKYMLKNFKFNNCIVIAEIQNEYVGNIFDSKVFLKYLSSITSGTYENVKIIFSGNNCS